MLRYPHISTRDLGVVFPELADVDPAILSRVDIEGKPTVPSILTTFDTDQIDFF
jgi:hypothetical protein